MRVEVDCATARVVEGTPDERRWLREYLTFEDPQARFHNGDPLIELVNPVDDSFPSGFAGKVRKAAATRTHPSGRLDPIEVELVDVRTRPPPRVPVDLSWLRPYQQQAVEAALTRTRGIIQMPTGAGKSVAAAAIIASVPEAKWLVLVPQSDLLEQFAKHLRERLGEEPGLIGDGHWNPQRVTVATFQTLSRRMSKQRDQATYAFMRSVQGMIVDEAHSVAAGTFSFVTSKATNAFYRLGISATPLDRSDRKSIFVLGQFGGIIHKVTSAELRAQGYLAEATIRMARLEQGCGAPTWQGVYGECVVRSKPRNALVAEMAARVAKPALVFVSQVKQGKVLMPLLKAKGLKAEFVWGEDDTDGRRTAIKALVEGRLDVIVASNVFAQGVDIPSLAGIVNAAAGMSVILTLQRLGRGTRITESKRRFEVWDVLDDGNRHLAKHGRQRLDVYENEGFVVERLEAADLVGTAVATDSRRDEHGFLLGSAAQQAHRQDQRRAALMDLAGVPALRNGRRGKIAQPHRMAGYTCTVCGAEAGNSSPECPGYRVEEEPQKRLI